jgi:hypothetical protein
MAIQGLSLDRAQPLTVATALASADWPQFSSRQNLNRAVHQAKELGLLSFAERVPFDLIGMRA